MNGPRRRRLLFTPGAALAVVILASQPVAAQSPSVPEIVIGGVGGGEALPLEVDRMYPGGPEAVARYVLRRGSGFSGGSFSTGVEDVEDIERGCNRPESNAGDTTCGAGADQGELSDQLLLGQAWSSDVANCASAPPPASGSVLRELDDVVLAAPAALSEGDAVCLVLAAVLPFSADNLVQTDLARFDLRLGLTDAEPVAVLNRSFGPPAAGAGGTTEAGLSAAGFSAPRALPFTGLALTATLLWAAVLVGLGEVLVAAGRRRRSL